MKIQSVYQQISTNMMANNLIRAVTLRNIHVSYNTHFQAKQLVYGKNEIKNFTTLKYIHAYRKQC